MKAHPPKLMTNFKNMPNIATGSGIGPSHSVARELVKHQPKKSKRGSKKSLFQL